jgi:CheY-like chemotaxis protein
MVDVKWILIVDDVGHFAKAIAGTLNKNGYVADHTDSPQQALKLLSDGRVFDAVLTDLRMPGMSGVELLREIQDKFQIPVIIMSGFGRELEELRHMQDDTVLLAKPFNNKELLEALSVACRKAA